MKYVITGGAGHISKPLVERLLLKGHQVTVVSRNQNNVAPLIEKGAHAAIGSLEEVNFLTRTFRGADAVYTMIPPNMAATDWKKWISQIGENYAQAIIGSGVKKVVNLSSIGAHMPEGCGPVSGLYGAEKALNALKDVDILHLRPGFFYPNFYAQIGMIKNLGIAGGNYGSPGKKIVLADTGDIADAAAEELLAAGFRGHHIRYIASDEKSGDEIAKILGTAIGKPGLTWVDFTDEQAFQGALQAGLPEEIAKNYTEMGSAIRSGAMMEDYFNNRPTRLGKTKLEDFANIFSNVFHMETLATTL